MGLQLCRLLMSAVQSAAGQAVVVCVSKRLAHRSTIAIPIAASTATAAVAVPLSLLCSLQAVRDSGDTAPEVHVPIDTLTFDRVLIFLEAQALNRNSPGFAIHLLDDLQQVN